MAIGAGTIWRVRPGGSSTNGAGYDPTISGAATDYSQQDSAQATGTLGTASGTTAFTDAGGAFTSAMIGNALRIASGAGFTVGYYFITAFTSSTAVTLDRSPGTGTVANWKLGGAAGGSGYNPFLLGSDSRAVGDKMVPGNTVYILGSSTSPTVASPDYNFTGTQLNPNVAGNTTAGPCKFVVDPSQPTWRPLVKNTGGDPFIINSNNGLVMDGMILVPTSNSNNRMFDAKGDWLLRNVTFNMNDVDTAAILCNNAMMMVNCEVFSKLGSTPTSGSLTAIALSGQVSVISGCNFHDLGIIAISASDGLCVENSIFNNSTKVYLLLNGSNNTFRPHFVRGNTFNGKTSGGSDGVQVTTGEALAGLVMLDNIFSNFATATKAAVNVSGTLATNDRIKMMLDYNDYYNNTTNCTGFTIGANDLTLDPQYTSSPSDLTLSGTNLQAQAYPRGPIVGG